MEKPEVSIICLVYNMKDYLRQSLDGILMQKTDFPFEIVVHDDCSTDGSTDIVREYAEKYPDIIVPIIQTENQHSKGLRITRDLVLPVLRGKYAAFCEGDDYWTDPDKLQKQYDFMEANPDYSLCGAKIRMVNCSDPTVPDCMIRPFTHTGEVTMEDIVKRTERQTFGTCSLFFRTEVLRARPEDFPSRGDRPLVFWLMLNGRVWYIDDEVGVYRRARPGSWTVTNYHSGAEKKIKLYLDYLSLYKTIDDYSKGTYAELFQGAYYRYMQLALRAGAKYSEITKGKGKECYERLSPKYKRKLRTYKLLLPLRKAASAVKKKISK